jgi:hypothetical protein
MKSKISFLVVFFVGLVWSQLEPTPYELIRPVWPLEWKPEIFDIYVAGVRSNSIPSNRTPYDYTPGGIIPDTLNQAYLDAINLDISPIRLNQAGYRPADQKLIYYVGTASAFTVVDEAGAEVGTGTFSSTGVSTSSAYKIIAGVNAQRNLNIRYTAETTGPAGDLQRGYLPDGLPENTRLRVKVGSEYSATFIISDQVYSMVRSATLKFLGINRSGDSESWFHPPSHTKDGSGPVVVGQGGGNGVNGVLTPQEGAMQGGWYDCGDHLKESQTQAYAFMVLAVMAATNPERDVDVYAYNHGDINNTDGIPDLLREARHGADYFIRAYDMAGGVIDNMPASVGNFGADHGWWGRPEYQDFIPASITGRGGPHERDLRLGELGSNISGQIAAGLALLSVHYRAYDEAFANKALQVATEMYDFAKGLATGAPTYGNNLPYVHNTIAAGWSSAAYNGNNEYHDDLALAAIAMLYATKDNRYLSDAVLDPALAGGQTKSDFIGNNQGLGTFYGGWFTDKTATLLKDVKNTSWANAYTYALYAFYKLILATDEKAAQYGITNQERLMYAEDVLVTLAANLGDMSVHGGDVIPLPTGAIMWKQHQAAYNNIWFNMNTDQTWIYNRYQSGNIFEVLAYADVAKDLENVTLPRLQSSALKTAEMEQLGVNQMNYILGLNPWDLSMLLGVGDKNDAHPHHRAANPEGKNVPGGDYLYRPPTGAIYGGITPEISGNVMAPSSMSWEDYHLSETCIDGTATFIGAATLLAKKEDLYRAPDVTVEINYVGFDSVIVTVRQSMFGNATIQYGTQETALTSTTQSSEPGVKHTFVLKPLQNGTPYYFTATAYNQASGNFKIKYRVDSTQTPYSFTTLNSLPAAADIQNVKECNVSADSAEVMWYTPNGEYESKIYWDTILTTPENMRWSQSGDISGFPTKFHYMKIGGLQERTTYYYAVESNGVIKAVDENNLPLQFTTPVTQYDFEVRTYEYNVGGLQFVNFNIYNKEERAFDSLELRLYVNATQAQMVREEGSTYCPTMFDSDICQAYNEAGFNLPCENDRELRDLLRGAIPRRMDDTYNPNTGTYAWYIPLPLGSTTIKSSSRLRLDVRFSSGIANRQGDGWKCDPMVQPAAKTFSGAAGDWTWRAHQKATGSPVDYVGMPQEDKEFGDADLAPVNPYLAVYRKDEFVWGYSPSYQEQSTKRANYEMKTTLLAPFNVPDGSFVQLDASSSTFYVTGTSSITENGQINQIWVNGDTIANVAEAAVYNPASDRWDLRIPVKMKIGTNKVDITIFAGPDLNCAECQESGSCAFTNNQFFVDFSKGDMTASMLSITDVATGEPVASPAEPGMQFHIQVRDEDKRKANVPSIDVLLINALREDTVTIKVPWNDAAGAFVTSTPIQAVSTSSSALQANQVSFFGGDTIQVVYIDPDDDEDVSKQSFFAQANYPALRAAKALDQDCDGVTDALRLLFESPFTDKHSMDSLWLVIKDPRTQAADSFFVLNTTPILGQNDLTISIPPRAGLFASSNPTGSVTAFINTAGEGARSTANLEDGIAPVMTGVSLLENPDGKYANDTLMISFSEPVVLASKQIWPLDIFDFGQVATNTPGLQVVGSAVTNNNGRSWMYAVSGNVNKAIIDSGFTASIKADMAITDNAMNQLDAVSGCGQPVPVIEVPRPVPIIFAAIQDTNANGYPDELHLRFETKLRDKDMLDSFELRWGNPGLLRTILPASPKTWPIFLDTFSREVILKDDAGNPVLNADSIPVKTMQTDSLTVMRIPLSEELFPFGTTSGPLDGKGGVTPRLGAVGGFFDKEYSVNDSIGPVAVLARLGQYLKIDTIGVVLSEKVTMQEDIWVLQRKRGSDIVTYMPSSQSLSTINQSHIRFIAGEVKENQVRVGDHVRLIPVDPAVLDRAQNPPPMEAPWIVIKGALSDKVAFTVHLQNDITMVSSEKIQNAYGDDPPDAGEHFRVTIMVPESSKQFKYAEGRGSVSQATGATYDSSFYSHAGPVFEVGIEIPGVNQMLLGQEVWSATVSVHLFIYDMQGQYVNDLHVNIPLDQNIKPLLDSDEKLNVRIEWMVADKTPVSSTGKQVGNGAFVGRFYMKAQTTALVDDEPEWDEDGSLISAPRFKKGDARNSSKISTKRFGLIRAK